MWLTVSPWPPPGRYESIVPLIIQPECHGSTESDLSRIMRSQAILSRIMRSQAISLRFASNRVAGGDSSKPEHDCMAATQAKADQMQPMDVNRTPGARTSIPEDGANRVGYEAPSAYVRLLATFRLDLAYYPVVDTGCGDQPSNTARAARLASNLMLHSHTRTTVQPASAASWFAAASRARVRSSFRCQRSAFGPEKGVWRP